MMFVNSQEAGELLLNRNNILILAHKNPDGDTLGSSYALLRALKKLDKRARVECADKIDAKYKYLYSGIKQDKFEPEYIVAVDVADEKLLGDSLREQYSGRIDLCIDHHPSNTLYARKVCLHPEDAAAAQGIYRIIRRMKVRIDPEIADCIYTGIATDTGCFRYSNTQAATHMIAAQMMDEGADASEINISMFETKPLGYFKLLSAAIAGVQMFFKDECAVITITQDMFAKTGTDESDCEAIAAVARQIAGVKVGITMREKADGTWKFSVRTYAPADAAKICKALGGGGHMRASGCESKKPKKDALADILKAAEDELAEHGLL